MSNKLNRKARRRLDQNRKEEFFMENKDKIYNHLARAEAEMKDSMEHTYTGLWWALAAIAMHRARLSGRTIAKVLKTTDDLYGGLLRNELTVEDVSRMAREEANVGVEFHVDREYVELSQFEEGRTAQDVKEIKYYLDNIAHIQRTEIAEAEG